MGTEPGDDYVAFVRARQGSLLRAAVLACGDRHVAEDLLQDALVKLAGRWEKVRDEAPEAYVRKILYRDAISRWRRHRREVVVDHQDGEGVLSRLPHPDHRVDDWVGGAEVRAALQLLPPRQRAVVVLRYFEDLSEAEIAEALGIARGTVKSQASDALRTLRRLLPDRPAARPSGGQPQLKVVGEDRGWWP